MLRNELLEQVIQEHAERLVKEAGEAWPEGLQAIVEHPGNMEHGEYSTNMAMKLARSLRKPPVAIAEQLKLRLEGDDRLAVVQRIEVVAPGFMNMYLDWSVWANAAEAEAEAIGQAARNAEQRAGTAGFSAKAGAKGKKAVIEHTSINPNKSAHVGHLRNSCIGDTLARMLNRAGYRVEVHNYIDDLGNQLADTVVGLLQAEQNGSHARFGDFCWDVYAAINRAYKQQPELQEERTKVLHALEEGAGNLAWIGGLTAERIVREHVEEMKQFGIRYDVLVWESNIVREGFWQAAFDLLRGTNVFRQEEEGKLAGCWVLKQPERDGAQESAQDEGTAEHQADKVLVRSNGILTYTAKDIAYHLWKFALLGKDFRYKKFDDGLWTTDRGGIKKPFGQADLVINVIDRRQEYPQAMVKQALHALGYNEQASELRHVGYGVVSLSPDTAASLGMDTSDGKGAYAMSGRQGIGIKVSDFLDRMEHAIEQKRSRRTGLSSRAIASAAVRYYLLRFHLQTEVVFDLQQATEVSGNTGVYLMYSYARAASLLQKAEKELGLTAGMGIAPNTEAIAVPALEPTEHALLRHIAYWPEVLSAAVEELAPNQICTYAHELATAFNHFYAVCPILKADDAALKFRVWLTARYAATMRDALQVLGLPAPNRM